MNKNDYKILEEFLDLRWQCVWRKGDDNPSQADLSYYNGVCDTIVQLGLYWQRKNEKHYVGNERRK